MRAARRRHPEVLPAALVEASPARGAGDEAELAPGQDVAVEVTRANGETFAFTAKCRIDTANEMEYYRNGGILHYVLRKLAA